MTSPLPAHRLTSEIYKLATSGDYATIAIGGSKPFDVGCISPSVALLLGSRLETLAAHGPDFMVANGARGSLYFKMDVKRDEADPQKVQYFFSAQDKPWA